MFKQSRLFESNLAHASIYMRNGLLLGKYKGYVIDREDKYGVGRVKVHIPELMIDLKPNKDGIWALPRPTQEGQQSPPWYNEWLQIEFDNGDPNRSYYSGIIKHIDDGINEMNPLSGKIEKDFGNDKTFKSFDAIPFKAMPLKGPHNEAASKANVNKTPMWSHYKVMQDDNDLRFTESRSGGKQVRVQNDINKYTYTRTEKEFEIMQNEKDEYIEMNTPNKNEIRFDDKNKYVKLSSKNKNFIMLDDNSDAIIIGTKEVGSKIVKHKEEKICSDKSKIKQKYDVWHKKRKVSDDAINSLPSTFTDFKGNNICCISPQKMVRINSFNAMSVHDGNTGFILLNPHQQ